MAKTIGSFDLASLKVLRDDVTQYFWFEPDSSSAWGSGAHVTLYPESQFTDSTSPNYMKGQNIIMNTDGFSIRNGALPMMVLDNNSLDFNAIDTTLGTYTTMATFGLTGATIGQASGAHIQISSSGLDVNLNSSTNIASFSTDGARIGKINGAHSTINEDGQRFYATDGTTQLAHIGYGSGTSASGTAIAPYYDLGVRTSGSTKGNYSTVEGRNNEASGYTAHAEGANASARGNWSHAEGTRTYAIGDMSHAEGYNSYANGDYSHAEGYYSHANGDYSHAGGAHTIASSDYQTVIGRLNEEDTSDKYSFIIGNGENSVESNALVVDWLGGTRIAGNLFTGCNANSTGGYEFGRKTSSHIVVAGIHICWGRETISHTSSGYKEVQVTLPYTYTSTPYCFASYGNRPLGGAARTAYATQSDLAGNKIYVGSYATGSVTAYVNWMTIGV